MWIVKGVVENYLVYKHFGLKTQYCKQREETPLAVNFNNS